MIDRYSLTVSADAVAKRFSVEVPDHYKSRYNIAPSQLLPVITNSGPDGISWFYWGRPPQFANNKNLAERIINLRTEALHEKPTLRKTLLRHRCIIPADGWYTWKKIGKRTLIPHRNTLLDQQVFSFAGVYEEFEDENESTVHTFSVLTISGNEKGVDERLPVIFTREQEKIWLSNTVGEATLVDALTAYPLNKLNIYTVSPGISNPQNDYPSLIIPTPAADQHGNLTLFD